MSSRWSIRMIFIVWQTKIMIIYTLFLKCCFRRSCIAVFKMSIPVVFIKVLLESIPYISVGSPNVKNNKFITFFCFLNISECVVSWRSFSDLLVNTYRRKFIG